MAQKLTPQEQTEIVDVAKDLWKELCPDLYMDKFAKWVTDNKSGELEDYQKILIAPAKGIEGAVWGFIALFNPKTYRDFFAAIKTMRGMTYEDWCCSLQFMKNLYDNLSDDSLSMANKVSTANKVASAISLVYMTVFIGSGFGKINSLLKNVEKGASLQKIVKATEVSRSFVYNVGHLKILPATVIGGLTLKYIDTEKSG